jgi:hypothetical protein
LSAQIWLGWQLSWLPCFSRRGIWQIRAQIILPF